MTQITAIALSVASFLWSFYTLWITQLRRGRLEMTKPTMIFMGREGRGGREDPSLWPKIYLRTLLYCTADRGCIVENMHLIVHNEYGAYPFDFWAYGGEAKLAKGSGLFVPRTGVALHHHFVLNRNEHNFLFVGGDYRIEVFAKIAGQAHATKLTEIKIALVGEQSPAMIQIPDMGLFFELDAVSNGYASRIERRPEIPD